MLSTKSGMRVRSDVQSQQNRWFLAPLSASLSPFDQTSPPLCLHLSKAVIESLQQQDSSLGSSGKNIFLKKTTAQLASSAEYLNQMIAVKAHLGLISQLGTVVLSCGGQIVRGAGHMHQGVFFIAIILIGRLAGKLLHRLIKFMNNNYFIKVCRTIKNLSSYIFFSF